jgi:hypothetical protein
MKPREYLSELASVKFAAQNRQSLPDAAFVAKTGSRCRPIRPQKHMHKIAQLRLDLPESFTSRDSSKRVGRAAASAVSLASHNSAALWAAKKASRFPPIIKRSRWSRSYAERRKWVLQTVMTICFFSAYLPTCSLALTTASPSSSFVKISTQYYRNGIKLLREIMPRIGPY